MHLGLGPGDGDCAKFAAGLYYSRGAPYLQGLRQGERREEVEIRREMVVERATPSYNEVKVSLLFVLFSCV